MVTMVVLMILVMVVVMVLMMYESEFSLSRQGGGKSSNSAKSRGC